MPILVCAVRKNKYKYFKEDVWSLLQAVCTWKKGSSKFQNGDIFIRRAILPDWYRQILCSLCTAQPKLSVGFPLRDTFLLMWEKKADEWRHCTWLQNCAPGAGSLSWMQVFMVPSLSHMMLAALFIFPLSSFPKRKCRHHLYVLGVSLSMKVTWDGNNKTVFCCSGLWIKGRCCWLCDVDSLVFGVNVRKKRKIFGRFLNLSMGEIVYRNTNKALTEVSVS